MQGLILLNKPKGMTSFSAVSAIKRLAGEKRVGHTGTLDPMATGVLPILIGRATTLSSLMLDADKRYVAEVKLGIATDTDDITGSVISEREVSVSEEELIDAINKHTGVISQVPPAYSAIKKDGVRMYQLAREGKSVNIAPRKVEIYSLELISFDAQKGIFKMSAHVSKGTYIRSLARDIGEYLGCGATLTELCRTYASGFNLEECVRLEKLDSSNIGEHLHSEEIAVSHLPEVSITKNQAVRFCNGGQLGFERLSINPTVSGELYRVKFDSKLIGIGKADIDNNQLNIKAILNYPEG